MDQYRSSHSPCSYHNLVSWKPSTGAHCPRVKMYMRYANRLCCITTTQFITTAFNTTFFPPVFKNCIHQHHNSICNVRMYVIANNYLQTTFERIYLLLYIWFIFFQVAGVLLTMKKFMFILTHILWFLMHGVYWWNKYFSSKIFYQQY